MASDKSRLLVRVEVYLRLSGRKEGTGGGTGGGGGGGVNGRGQVLMSGL